MTETVAVIGRLYTAEGRKLLVCLTRDGGQGADVIEIQDGYTDDALLGLNTRDADDLAALLVSAVEQAKDLAAGITTA